MPVKDCIAECQLGTDIKWLLRIPLIIYQGNLSDSTEMMDVQDPPSLLRQHQPSDLKKTTKQKSPTQSTKKPPKQTKSKLTPATKKHHHKKKQSKKGPVHSNMTLMILQNQNIATHHTLSGGFHRELPGPSMNLSLRSGFVSLHSLSTLNELKTTKFLVHLKYCTLPSALYIASVQHI